MPDPSATLPVKDGFRLRGAEMTRIETFTDAAFAFALTLLVVSLTPPTSIDQLGTALRGVPSFVMSAMLLMMFWWGHHEWSRRFGLDDGRTMVLSCALVFTVLVYVYPLRFVSGLMMSWIGRITGLPLGSGVEQIDGPGDINHLFVIYGFGFVVMCGVLVLLNLHAWRERERLELDALERLLLRAEIGAWTIVAAAGVLSIALGLLLPPGWVGVPGWAYMLLPIAMPLYGRVNARRRAALEAGATPRPVGAA
ncbi:MAG TPA: TMEM175 family protein [Longimicrobiaceae bacterium]|nr:TMEM175 family protein [Longimicrobiaceae bacterium]